MQIEPMPPRKLLEGARTKLEEEGNRDPSLVAFIIRDHPVIEEAGLSSLAWLLAGNQYGCHKNDVIGLLDLLEQYLDQQEAECSTCTDQHQNKEVVCTTKS